MTIPFVNLLPAHDEIRISLDKAIDRVRDRGIFLNGPEVEAFESEWAAYCNQRFCVACASGTDALAIACEAESQNTFTIPANTLQFTLRGLRKEIHEYVKLFYYDFIDCDERGFPEELGSQYIEDTGEAMPVEVLLYGRQKRVFNGEFVDACQAHGWKPNCGAAWSFYPTKNLGAFGDAGAYTTNNSESIQDARELRDKFPSRMSEINAAVLRTKLPHLDRWNAERAAIAEVYYNELPEWAEPACRPGEPTNHHIFAVLVERRDELKAHLEANGVQTKVHYPEPLADLPGARRWCSRTLSLPCWPGLTPMQVLEVCDTIRSFK